MNEKQIQIITDLLIDNGLILNDVNPVLMWDPTFCRRLTSIRDYCYHLYIDTLNGKVNIELAMNRITYLLNSLALYRDSYGDSLVGTIGSQMYVVMNSFFDKTNEAFHDFMLTL